MWRRFRPRPRTRVNDCDRRIDSRLRLAVAHGHGCAHMITGSPLPTVQTRVHDCELHVGFSQWRPRLDPNGAPLGRYMTIIDLRQFAHHRHHVTIHAEWGGGANEHARTHANHPLLVKVNWDDLIPRTVGNRISLGGTPNFSMKLQTLFEFGHSNWHQASCPR